MGLYGAWMTHDVGGPGYIREYGNTAYIVKIVRGVRGTAYDVSRRAPGYGGNTYLGQFRTREGAFRVAARDAKIRGLTAPKGNPKSSSSAWGVFPHAEQRKPTGRGFVVRAMESGYPVDQFNYGGVVPVAVFGKGARRAAENLAGKMSQEQPHRGNPQRKKRSSGRRRRPIRQSMRVVSRGVTADVRRAFGGKLPRSFKSNPMSRKDFEYMAAVIADAQLQGAPVNVTRALTDFSVDLGKRSNPRFDADRFVRRILQLVSEKAPWRYVNKNPRRNPLAVFGANPARAKTVRDLGRVMEIHYKRNDDGKFYKHGFKIRPRLLALSDGTIAVRP